MKIRKVGRVKASEVKAYQVANGLQVDGRVAIRLVVYGFSTTASATATDTSTPFTQSLEIPTDGFAVRGGVAASGPEASSWTNLTEDVDADFAESSETYGMASSSTAGTADRNMDTSGHGSGRHGAGSISAGLVILPSGNPLYDR